MKTLGTAMPLARWRCPRQKETLSTRVPDPLGLSGRCRLDIMIHQYCSLLDGHNSDFPGLLL